MATISLRDTVREYERVLASVFGLLVQSGMSQRAILTLTTRARKTASARNRKLGRSGAELTTLALVLDAWHRNRRYLTSKGKPKPMRLFGAAPSVEALIRSEGEAASATKLVHRIRSLRLVTRCPGGSYRPTSNAALISICDPAMLQYVARSLISFLGTVESNLGRPPHEARLLERCAEIPDLPHECMKQFQEFSWNQGDAFTRIVNDWLQTRRTTTSIASKHSGVRAGVHVHAYLMPTPVRRASTAKRPPT
jgi:hypothetical protein